MSGGSTSPIVRSRFWIVGLICSHAFSGSRFISATQLTASEASFGSMAFSVRNASILR